MMSSFDLEYLIVPLYLSLYQINKSDVLFLCLHIYRHSRLKVNYVISKFIYVEYCIVSRNICCFRSLGSDMYCSEMSIEFKLRSI